MELKNSKCISLLSRFLTVKALPFAFKCQEVYQIEVHLITSHSPEVLLVVESVEPGLLQVKMLQWGGEQETKINRTWDTMWSLSRRFRRREKLALAMIRVKYRAWNTQKVSVGKGKGSEKKWEFSHLGGAFFFDIFSHFKKWISKHALNHAKMQRNIFLFLLTPLFPDCSHF